MGPRLLSLPQTQRWMGNPMASPEGFREDDGPKGPRPPWLLGLVRRYKASTHQTHSRVVTTQLIFKTRVYVLCAPTDCKPHPPHLEYKECRLSTSVAKSRDILCCCPKWISDASSLGFPQLLSRSYLSSRHTIHLGTDSWDQSEMKKKQLWKYSKRA